MPGIILPISLKDSNRSPVRTGVILTQPKDVKNKYFAELKPLVNILKAQGKIIKDKAEEGGTRAELFREIEKQKHIAERIFDKNSIIIATAFVGDLSAANTEKIESMFKRLFSIPFAELEDAKEINAAKNFAVRANADLISTIPDEYFGDIVEAVQNNFLGIKTNGLTLAGRIQQIGGISKRRAEFIARDQTSKNTAAFTQIRHQFLGIEEYTWHNVGDERVVGRPGGVWPKPTRGHGNHWVREGKKFSFDKPPFDGPPGHAYNCRCRPAPIVNLNEISATYR